MCLSLCRRIWVTSEETLAVQFNPAVLLSIGDARAFVAALLANKSAPGEDVSGGMSATSTSALTGIAGSRGADIPALAEQMAERGAITSRVPQKYLIQNNTGLRAYYWAEQVSLAANKRDALEMACASTLYGVSAHPVELYSDLLPTCCHETSLVVVALFGKSCQPPYSLSHVLICTAHCHHTLNWL